jgi:hypothetical protein
VYHEQIFDIWEDAENVDPVARFYLGFYERGSELMNEVLDEFARSAGASLWYFSDIETGYAFVFRIVLSSRTG